MWHRASFNVVEKAKDATSCLPNFPTDVFYESILSVGYKYKTSGLKNIAGSEI